nr:hypothetical protein [Flavisolibacter sp.]
YLPLVFTAYFALLFTFLETFNFISGKEAKKEIGYNSDNNQIVTQKDNATETPALVVSVVMQLLSLAAVFLLTWYMLEKKLKYFN